MAYEECSLLYVLGLKINYFLWGAILSGIAMFIYMKNKPPGQPGGRTSFGR